MNILRSYLVILVVAVSSSGIWGAEHPVAKTEPKMKVQTECPVMGGKISKDLFVDYEGKRIYVCQQACIDATKKDPAKYVKKLEDAGVILEAVPVELCKKCGEIKSSENCCKAGAAKCPKCGLDKGSPGCCKITKDVKEPVMLCPKCKEIMGTAKCCMMMKKEIAEKANEMAKEGDAEKKE